MIELKYKFTNDTLFKMLFVRHPGLLKKLVAVLLKIRVGSIGSFHISEYQALEVTRLTQLSDRFVLKYFELPKLPSTVTSDNGLELWLSLFKAKTEQDLANIESLGVEEMSEAINAYRQITVTPEFQEAERLRSKARHDEAQALHNMERKTKLEIAKNLLNVGDTIEKIISVTGLTRADIEGLHDSI